MTEKKNVLQEVIKHLLVWGLLAISLTYTLLFVLVGLVPVQSDNLNIIGVIDVLTGILTVNSSSLYADAVGLGLGITYIAAIVAMVKNLISGGIALRNVFANDDPENKKMRSGVLRVMDSFGKNYFWVLCFAVVARMFHVYTPDPLLVAVLISGAVLHVLVRIGFSILEKGDVAKAFCQYGICNSIVVACAAVLMISLCSVNASEMFYGLEMFGAVFSGNSTAVIVDFLFSVFFKNIFLIIIQIRTLAMINDLIAYINYKDVGKSAYRSVMIQCIVLGSVAIIVSVYCSNSILPGLTDYISCIACSVALLVSNYFPTFIEPEQKKSQKKGAYQPYAEPVQNGGWQQGSYAPDANAYVNYGAQDANNYAGGEYQAPYQNNYGAENGWNNGQMGAESQQTYQDYQGGYQYNYNDNSDWNNVRTDANSQQSYQDYNQNGWGNQQGENAQQPYQDYAQQPYQDYNQNGWGNQQSGNTQQPYQDYNQNGWGNQQSGNAQQPYQNYNQNGWGNQQNGNPQEGNGNNYQNNYNGENSWNNQQ